MSVYRVALINATYYVVNLDGHGVADFPTRQQAERYIADVEARQLCLRVADPIGGRA